MGCIFLRSSSVLVSERYCLDASAVCKGFDQPGRCQWGKSLVTCDRTFMSPYASNCNLFVDFGNLVYPTHAPSVLLYAITIGRVMTPRDLA